MKLIIKKIWRNLYNYGLLITLKKAVYFVFKPLYKNLTYKIYFIGLNNLKDKPVGNHNFIYKFVVREDIKIIK